MLCSLSLTLLRQFTAIWDLHIAPPAFNAMPQTDDDLYSLITLMQLLGERSVVYAGGPAPHHALLDFCTDPHIHAIARRLISGQRRRGRPGSRELVI